MKTEIPTLSTWIHNTPEASHIALGEFLHDPSTGDRLQENRSSSADQADRAIASAWAAHDSREWQLLGIEGRAALMMRLAQLIDEKQHEIASLDSLNSGVTLRETTLFASSLGGTIRSAVELARSQGDSTMLAAQQGPVVLRRIPWGPTALIVPWNAPSAVAVKKMAYALIAGATVVLKPSPSAPWSSQIIASAVAETRIPDGVFSLLLGGGEVGHQICSDQRIRAISMTGSTATGRRIAQASAQHLTHLRLELGSNNPALVLADADIAGAVDSLVAGMTKLNGQWCEAPRRVFAHQSIYTDLLHELTDRLKNLRVGSSFDDETQVGPMAFRQRREDLKAQRDSLVAGGCVAEFSSSIPAAGWFFAPSVVSGSSVPLPGEVFGPMIAVESYTSLDSALSLANRGPHGLAGYVFSRAVDRAIEVGGRIEGGEIKINGTSVLDMAPQSAQSFFGDSGLGGHGDVDVLDFYSGKQVVGLDLPGAPI